MPEPKTSRGDYLGLALILALAAALRLPGLNSSLWHDEVQTLITHVRLPWSEMLQSYSMNHHYLHNIAAKVSVSLFGESAWALRLPALLFGLGTLWAMWALARHLAGTAIAHVTTLLLALSYHQIWFSQNARGYTGLAFFSTLGMLLFLRGIRRPRPGTWIGYGLCLAAAVFTHLTGAFFFAAQGLVWLALVVWRGLTGRLDAATAGLPLMGFAIGAAVSLALYLPILPSLIETVGGVSGSSASDVMQEYQNPLWTAFEAIRTGIGQTGPLVGLVGGAVLALSLLGAVALGRDEPLFAPVTFGHILLTVVLLMAVGMRIWPRFFFADIGFLMLLIVLGVRLACAIAGQILGGERLATGLFALAVIAMLGISAVLAKRNYALPKQDLEGAYHFARQLAEPGTRVYAVGYAGENFSLYGADWPIIYTSAEYRAALAEPGPVVLIVGFPERTFRDVPELARDAGVGAGDPCGPGGAPGAVLVTARCFAGTLGDGGLIVFVRG
ncbi:glycosyltransferase family 39 protein [Albidovulum sp.]